MKLTDDEVNEARITGRKITYSILNKWCVSATPDEVSDIIDMAIAMSLPKFNPLKGKFNTWLYFHILEECRCFVHNAVRHKSCPPYEANLSYTIDAALEIREVLALWIKNIPNPKEAVIVNGLLKDIHLSSLAKTLGVCQPRVSQIKREALKRLEVLISPPF